MNARPSARLSRFRLGSDVVTAKDAANDPGRDIVLPDYGDTTPHGIDAVARDIATGTPHATAREPDGVAHDGPDWADPSADAAAHNQHRALSVQGRASGADAPAPIQAFADAAIYPVGAVLVDVPPVESAAENLSLQLRPEQATDDLCPTLDDVRLAETFRVEGDVTRAEAAYRQALDADPVRVDALLGLALMLLLRGDSASAQLPLLRCCGVAPSCAAAWDGLGLALTGTGDYAEAETAYAAAQRLCPDRFDYALRRIGACLLAGTADAELARTEVATLANPLDVVSLTAHGVLLNRLGRLAEAAEILEAAAAIAPEASEPAIELANVLIHTDRSVAADQALLRAIELRPDQWLLRNNRAVILMRLHRFAEARTELDALVRAHGAQPGILCNLSSALTALGEQDGAVAAARDAIALEPGLHLAHRAYLNAVAYQDGIDGAAMLRAARATSDCIVRHATSDGIVRHATSDGIVRDATSVAPIVPSAELPSRDKNPERRIRVGVLSTMLKTHPVGWLTVAGIENLDPDAFEIVCIAQPESADPITRRFRAAAAEWHPIVNGDAPSLAAQVRSAGIDVLIELSGYGDRGVMAACAYRAAPVQVKWVGMQNHSTGLPEMDWFITDHWETPAGFEHLYSERLLRMPDGYVCYSPPPYAPEVGPLPAIASGRVTFGCFNNLAKITPVVVATWARLLRECPTSRLVLKTHQFSDAATCSRIVSLFDAHGIEAGRLELRGSSSHRSLLEQYNDIDIVLDPFPYVGGLTTCEALWMGVPTVTLAGETFSARHATSHLSNVGLEDWVATDVEGYVKLALARAASVQELSALRAQLRGRVKASALCDGPRFGRHLGSALRQAWRAWCDA